MIRRARNLTLAAVLGACCWSAGFAQAAAGGLPNAPDPSPQPAPGPAREQPGKVTVWGAPRGILKDQEAIWTSPAHIRESNALGPIVLVLATAATMTIDHQAMSSSKLQNSSLNNEAVTASNGLLGGFVAAPVLIYGMGWIHHDDHATETGILSGEAMVDALAVDEVMKVISMRERPTLDDAKGKFFQTSVGFNSSFPSTHTMIAWSSASAIASEYDGPLTKLTAYGLATGVSLTRVLGREHFPSDVLVGSALGWMIGRYVVHRHRHYGE